MERYLLFGFYGYYPSGGMNDLRAKFNDVNDFTDALSDTKFDLGFDFYQLLNTETGEIRGLNLYGKIEEYEDINGEIDCDDERDLRIKLLIEFLKMQ